MSAFIHATASDASEIFQGLRASLPSAADRVEAVVVLSAAAFLTVCLNVLF